MARQFQCLQLLSFVLVIALLFVGRSAGQGDKANFSQEFFEPFNGNPGKDFSFELWGEDAKNHVVFEPAGLRITLPSGYPKQRQNTGVSTTGPAVCHRALQNQPPLSAPKPASGLGDS